MRVTQEMDWLRLLSHKRRWSRENDKNKFGRSDFQRDYDRIIFSTDFRRLQNKTQVVPNPENDTVHTRLTHSLEVASIGRSLGHIVGSHICSKNPELAEANISTQDFESIVSAACLAHDIGNPPFGHSGENSISDFFRSPSAESIISKLKDEEIADLQNFEGNAYGFRLLVNSFKLKEGHSEHNLGLTFASLASFMKYPKESLAPKDGGVSSKKFGFFQTEKEIFSEIAKECGLVSKEGKHLAWYRHPLAFLVEAADDIAYRITDYEDGYKQGAITLSEFEDPLYEIISDQRDSVRNRQAQIDDLNERAAILRAVVIRELIHDCAEIFIRNENNFRNSSFDRALLRESKFDGAIREIESVSVEKIYRRRSVIESEIVGHRVLSGLLGIFTKCLFDDSEYMRNVRSLIPKQFISNAGEIKGNPYSAILAVTGFVASMTDRYALELYRKLEGISI